MMQRVSTIKQLNILSETRLHAILRYAIANKTLTAILVNFMADTKEYVTETLDFAEKTEKTELEYLLFIKKYLKDLSIIALIYAIYELSIYDLGDLNNLTSDFFSSLFKRDIKLCNGAHKELRSLNDMKYSEIITFFEDTSATTFYHLKIQFLKCNFPEKCSTMDLYHILANAYPTFPIMFLSTTYEKCYIPHGCCAHYRYIERN